MTFSSHTGWYRLNIWEYGTQSVLNNPVFGIGLNDWERPAWMGGSSVDNFWLLIAMRHGLPSILLLGAAVALSVLYILRTPIADVLTARMRTGYLVTMVGLFLALATVHVWEQVAVLVFFYIGMGAWLFSDAARRARPGSGGEADKADKRDLRYSRYPTRIRAQSAHPAAHPYARPRPGETTS
jgi:O-antigen ligase